MIACGHCLKQLHTIREVRFVPSLNVYGHVDHMAQSHYIEPVTLVESGQPAPPPVRKRKVFTGRRSP